MSNYYEIFEVEWYVYYLTQGYDEDNISIVREGFIPVSRYINYTTDFFTLSIHPFISCSHALKNQHLSWSWTLMSHKIDVSIQKVRKHPNINWSWCALSQNPSITLNVISLNRDLPWDSTGLSRHPMLTLDYINKNKDIQWNWYAISQTINVNEWTIDVLYQYPWCFVELSKNKSLPFRLVIETLDNYPWCFVSLSYNTTIDIHYVISNIELNWDWYGLSRNIAVPLDFILNNPHLSWSWYGVTNRTDVTVEHFIDFQFIPWHSSTVRFKTILREKDDFLRNKYRRFFMENIHDDLMSTVYHYDNYNYIMTYL